MSSSVSNAVQNQSRSQGRWSSGLFVCTEDIGICCLTFWCPCITFGRMVEIIDEGSCSCESSGALYLLINCLTGTAAHPLSLAFLYSCFYRSELRRRYSLEGGPFKDFLVHAFCERCALCQEYRELKSRGFDMSKGWQGNLEKRAQGVQMAPVVQGGMTR